MSIGQGGLEISCKITAKFPATIKNHFVMNRYKERLESTYCEPKNKEILGSFLYTIPGPTLPIKKSESRDIRHMFSANQHSKRQKEESVVVID